MRWAFRPGCLLLNYKASIFTYLFWGAVEACPIFDWLHSVHMHICLRATRKRIFWFKNRLARLAEKAFLKQWTELFPWNLRVQIYTKKQRERNVCVASRLSRRRRILWQLEVTPRSRQMAQLRCDKNGTARKYLAELLEETYFVRIRSTIVLLTNCLVEISFSAS